jgi:hypothetical protein
MIRTGVFAAILLFACVISHGQAFKGMSYTSFGKEILSSSDSDRSIANMKTIGVDTVALNIWDFQDDANSTSIAPDFNFFSSSLPSIDHAISEIHSQGMQVMLKPNVDLRDGQWRGTINPSPGWFAAYGQFINDWADFAEARGVEMLSVGTEYNGTQTSEAEWRTVVGDVRQRYSGDITYSANWDSYQQVAWWDAVDYIGIDAYFPLANNNSATLADMQQSWTGIANTIENWRSNNGLNKQVLFTEVGYRSVNGAVIEPWGASGSGVDLQEQADAYEALLSTMTQRGWWDGAFWWDWDPNPTAGGPNDDGFTPQHKPAQEVVRQYYGGEALPAPLPGTPTTQLGSFEQGHNNWTVVDFTDQPVTLGVSNVGATDGNSSLAVSQTVDSHNENHFSWGARFTFDVDSRNAMDRAFEEGPEHYLIEFDITYDTDSIPQDLVSWMNASVALIGNGIWNQVNGMALSNGHTDETIHVSIPLDSFPDVTADAYHYSLFLAINGDWGPGTATIYYDNFQLMNRRTFEGDFNADGVIDAADYTIWRDTLSSTGDLRADSNGDGVVGPADYAIWLANYGAFSSGENASSSQAPAVPEPTALALVAFWAIAQVTRQSRRG